MQSTGGTHPRVTARTVRTFPTRNNGSNGQQGAAHVTCNAWSPAMLRAGGWEVIGWGPGHAGKVRIVPASWSRRRFVWAIAATMELCEEHPCRATTSTCSHSLTAGR